MSGRLTVRNLYKEYADPDEGTIVAVDDLSLDIDDGEMIIVVGPSGCGKSTTLRCIAGLTDPTSGEILIDGADVTDLPARKRDVAMVFQDYALYPHMTARENMGFGLKMRTDLPKAEIRERVDRVAETMGIGDLLEKRPDEMSGGQQQRVALGRAIVREPAVFLMDEPLSNLDAKLRTKMRTEIQELQNELDVTTVYVTHNQTEAMTMGDRIAVMNHGNLQQFGTPLECYHTPNNTFVATFIGSPSMNLIDVASGGTGTLDADAFTYHLTDALREEVPDGDRFTFGFRPEDVELSETDPDFEVDVTVVEPRGDLTYVSGDLGSQSVTLTLPGTEWIEEGRTVGVRVPADAVYLFDDETGELLFTRKSPTDGNTGAGGSADATENADTTENTASAENADRAENAGPTGK
ncbi:ATP-binding cassette domain-containing protein [Halorubrum sp. JWXQ-INN 858]|uniref:ABC transporter ATP-binding protein n=1 Tax=Halorubrum sp. JWXQ-INN 858 TaxID=2690782 RepID=UPI00135A906C|nr:ABC transporter ATP-binding protein [Halorubrum sp. JWXQ-INN 858]MWV64393.1 ATP-binding cassette domain-containing protein [Halorubrum sp. JWXQ-INN 858]